MSECRRITDPAPVPYAVRKAARKSCVEAFADGLCLFDDLCPACTRAAMEALDERFGPLPWHEGFHARSAEGVAR